MASLRKPKSCPCGHFDAEHLFHPERWVCNSCNRTLATRPQRIHGICVGCGASEKDKKFKKGKNRCLDCHNDYMKKWRLKNPGWDSDPEFRRRRAESVKRAIEKSPESFIRHLWSALTRPSRKQKQRSNVNINPKRLAILNDIQIDLQYLHDLYKQQDGRCALTGLPMVHKFGDLCTISLDRKDGSLGYVPGNVQFVCKWANHAKSQHTDEEFRDMIERLKVL